MKPGFRAIRTLSCIALGLLVGIVGCKSTDSEQVKNGQTITAELPDSPCDSLLEVAITLNESWVEFPNRIPESIEECINQLDTLIPTSVKDWYACLPNQEFHKVTHIDLGLHLRNKWGLWAGSELSYFFLTNEIHHPDGMSSIILECYHQSLVTGNYNLDSVLTKRQKEIEEWLMMLEEKEKAEAERRAHTKRFVDSIHDAINYDSILKSTSGLIIDNPHIRIERERSDTTFYWTSGSSSPIPNSTYASYASEGRLGKSVFFMEIAKDGSIWSQTMKLQQFLKRNDTLFYRIKKLAFVPVLTPQMRENESIIQSWPRIDDCSMASSRIKIHWKDNSGSYYYLELQGDCRGTPLQVRYIIDQDLNVVFDSKETSRIWQSERVFDRKASVLR